MTDISNDGKASNVQQGQKGRKYPTHGQGYDYKGEHDKIGVILALRSEPFNHMVIYTCFVEKIKTYILSNFDDAKDLIPIVEELRDSMQDVINDEPTELNPGNQNSMVKLWMKQEEVKRHVKRITNLKNNKETLYGVVWGQCSAGLQEAIKADDDFEAESADFNVVWLLERAELISSGVDEKGNKYCTLLKALTAMCTIRQGQNESNDSFRKRVDSIVLTVNLIGGEYYLYSLEISSASNPTAPTVAEINEEHQKLKAMLMILRSDPIRYGNLQDSLFEGMCKGRDEFLTTVVQAYKLLQRISNDIYQNEVKNKFKTTRKSIFSRKKPHGVGNVSFTQKDVTCTLVPGKDGKVHEVIQCHNCHNMGHYANQCTKKKKVTLAQFTLTQNKLELINRDWVLLDTCSTVSVFCNSNLVHDIQQCDPGTGLTVVTNGGSQSYNHTAEFNLLPMKVHFNVHSIANILSLADVANLPNTKITMDSSQDKAIFLHHGDEVYKFEECVDGLYYWDSNNKPKASVSHYSLLNTVDDNKTLYCKKDVKGANHARNVQAIIAWPTDQEYTNIISNNQIMNSKVTVDDIHHASHIYGPALPLLQSRTVRKTPTAVRVEKYHHHIPSSPNIPTYNYMSTTFLSTEYPSYTPSRRRFIS